MSFTHLDERGKARMVDVTSKSETHRRAIARCTVVSNLDLARIISIDDLAAIEFAGRQGVKSTPQLIPLCHRLPIEATAVRVSIFGTHADIEAEVSTIAVTGVEMEALTATAIAALAAVYLVETRDPSVHIEDLAVWSKEGGKSGAWGRGV